MIKYSRSSGDVALDASKLPSFLGGPDFAFLGYQKSSNLDADFEDHRYPHVEFNAETLADNRFKLKYFLAFNQVIFV